VPGAGAVDLFTLTNANGVEIRATTYGAIITAIRVPDRAGRFADVVLGFDNLDGYLKQHPYFGTVVGRYGNRIGGGRFTLNGQTYKLAQNNGPNHLHGGIKGFDKYVWKAEQLPTDGASRSAVQARTARKAIRAILRFVSPIRLPTRTNWSSTITPPRTRPHRLT
jgi:galactose mutarotase-like enzyme